MKDKVIYFFCRKHNLRFYDILSIIGISFYINKISNESISFSDIDCNKTLSYILSAIFIVSFYITYQYIEEANNKVCIHEEEDDYDYKTKLLATIKTYRKRLLVLFGVLLLSSIFFIFSL